VEGLLGVPGKHVVRHEVALHGGDGVRRDVVYSVEMHFYGARVWLG